MPIGMSGCFFTLASYSPTIFKIGPTTHESGVGFSSRGSVKRLKIVGTGFFTGGSNSALRLHVHVEQPQAAFGKTVNSQCRCAARQPAAVAADFSVAQIVGQDKDNVGFLTGLAPSGWEQWVCGVSVVGGEYQRPNGCDRETERGNFQYLSNFSI